MPVGPVSTRSRPTGDLDPVVPLWRTSTSSQANGSEPATNPYTPQEVCSSAGRGTGYYIQRWSSFIGGVTYQLYSGSSGSSCVVTMKTDHLGTATPVSATLEALGMTPVSDSGPATYYAGPVILQANGKCVRFGGSTGTGSTSAPFGGCG